MLLAVLGLTLNTVGAVVLGIGLFRPPVARKLYPGAYVTRSPLEAAGDRAAGIIGAVWLAAGFGLQSLPLFGLDPGSAPMTRVSLSAAALAVAGSLSAVAYPWISSGMLRAIIRGWFKRRT